MPLVLNAVAAKTVVYKNVVGIAPELRFRSLRDVPRASAYELSTRKTTTLSVRAAVSTPQVERIVQTLWPRYYPEAILRIRRAGNIFAATYADEARIARLLAVATGIALPKLFGARRHDVGRLVVREIGVTSSMRRSAIGPWCSPLR